VWQSFVVLAAISLGLGLYTFDIAGLAYEFAIQMLDIILTCYLLWRVETLSDLSISSDDANEGTVAMAHVEDDDHSLSMRNNIGPLLKQHCEESRLYLQYDISLTELAKQIGTNRVYLSQHFAMQGTTYNTYINNLRIKHFISLYNEAAATHQPTTIQQLAYQSGFRSYGTFNTAFKQSMGMTATKWMRIQYR
jgi:AraC-like DNA-binding protein